MLLSLSYSTPQPNGTSPNTSPSQRSPSSLRFTTSLCFTLFRSLSSTRRSFFCFRSATTVPSLSTSTSSDSSTSITPLLIENDVIESKLYTPKGNAERNSGLEVEREKADILRRSGSRMGNACSLRMTSTESRTSGCYGLFGDTRLTFSKSSTDARSFTSFTKHRLTKSATSGENVEGIVTPFITAFFTSSSLRPSNGWFSPAISIRFIPNDHTSLFRHAFPSNTSGAAL